LVLGWAGAGEAGGLGFVSRVGKTVLAPEARNIPPPILLGRMVSRACFASWNEGDEAGCSCGGDGEGVEVVEFFAGSVFPSVPLVADGAGASDGLRGLEDTSLRMLPSSTEAFTVDLTFFSASDGSTISIGTRRRRGRVLGPSDCFAELVARAWTNRIYEAIAEVE
jgi:hypothetical protein